MNIYLVKHFLCCTHLGSHSWKCYWSSCLLSMYAHYWNEDKQYSKKLCMSFLADLHSMNHKWVLKCGFLKCHPVGGWEEVNEGDWFSVDIQGGSWALRGFNSRISWNEVGGVGKILTEERWCLQHQGKSKVTAHMSTVEAKRSDGTVLDKWVQRRAESKSAIRTM